jgi:hypothetical protein
MGQLTNLLDLGIYLFTYVFVFPCHGSMVGFRLQMEKMPPIYRVTEYIE